MVLYLVMKFVICFMLNPNFSQISLFVFSFRLESQDFILVFRHFSITSGHDKTSYGSFLYSTIGGLLGHCPFSGSFQLTFEKFSKNTLLHIV